MKLTAAVLSVLGLLYLWAATEHPLALIAVCVAAVGCAALVFLADDGDELAPYSPHQDIDL